MGRVSAQPYRKAAKEGRKTETNVWVLDRG